jgi:hypothetical protein
MNVSIYFIVCTFAVHGKYFDRGNIVNFQPKVVWAYSKTCTLFD